MATALPAHETKHLSVLSYSFFSSTFHINQIADGKHNGTGLWLGGQVLALYLADLLGPCKPKKDDNGFARRKRVIELGSGVGLTAIALASLGYDVLATDIPDIVQSVLGRNVESNLSSCATEEWGTIQVRCLDWTFQPSEWTWDDSHYITPIDSRSTANVPIGLRPSFDMVISADTIYDRELASDLLRSIHAVVTAPGTARSPRAYICIERRDPQLLDETRREAEERWGFKVAQISAHKIGKALARGGVSWDKAAWQGVEIWKLTLSPGNTGGVHPRE